jgi:hypothetical protein
VIGVDGGDDPPIDGHTNTEIEGDDKLWRHGEHGRDEVCGGRGAKDEAAAPGRC